MSMDLKKLLEEGKETNAPVTRTGSGKKESVNSGKMPRATPCDKKGSKWCIRKCRGNTFCPKYIHLVKELAGYTLVQSYMGVAIDHPEWVGKWKKL